MFICVLNIEDKEKLQKQGYKFLCENKQSDRIIYVFEDNKNLKFTKDVKVFRTNNLYF